MCSPNLHVYFDFISGHAHKEFITTIILIWGLLRAKFYHCFCTITLYFNFLSVGIVNISFQSAETGKYATPTRHLNFHFAPLAVSYELFPWWNQGFLDRTQEYTPVHFRKSFCELLPEKVQLSGHFAVYFEIDGTWYINGARDFTKCTLKIAGRAWQKDFLCYRHQGLIQKNERGGG